MPTCDGSLKTLFSELLDSLMTAYSEAPARFEDSSACLLIKLFQDSVNIFLDSNLKKLMRWIQFVCEKTSFQVQATYFSTWTAFMKNKESQLLLHQFVMSDFSTLANYILSHVQVVTSLKAPQDRHRADCIDEILLMMKETIDLDCLFLFSQGHQVFTQFMAFLDALYLQSFQIKTRVVTIGIIYSILAQCMAIVAPQNPPDPKYNPDLELRMRQSYERDKFAYASPYPQEVPPEVVPGLYQQLEHVSTVYFKGATQIGQLLNDKIF